MHDPAPPSRTRGTKQQRPAAREGCPQTTAAAACCRLSTLAAACVRLNDNPRYNRLQRLANQTQKCSYRYSKNATRNRAVCRFMYEESGSMQVHAHVRTVIGRE